MGAGWGAEHGKAFDHHAGDLAPNGADEAAVGGVEVAQVPDEVAAELAGRVELAAGEEQMKHWTVYSCLQ